MQEWFAKRFNIQIHSACLERIVTMLQFICEYTFTNIFTVYQERGSLSVYDILQ